MIRPSPSPLIATCALAIATLSTACSPTVKLEAPDKPIEINLNVKIEQEVRVSIAKEVSEAIANDPSLF